MPRKGQWVGGTDATVDNAQEVFLTSKQSITVEILVKVSTKCVLWILLGHTVAGCGKDQHYLFTGISTDRRNDLSPVSVQY